MKHHPPRLRLKEYRNGTWITESLPCDCSICKRSEELEKERKKQKQKQKICNMKFNKVDHILIYFYILALAASIGLNIYQYLVIRSITDIIK